MTIQSFTRSKCQSFQRSKCQARGGGAQGYRLYFWSLKYCHKGWPGPDDLRVYFGFYIYLQRYAGNGVWVTVDSYGISGFPEERFGPSEWGGGYVIGDWPNVSVIVVKTGATDSWTLNTGLSKNPGFYPLEEKIETGSGPAVFPDHADGTLSASGPFPIAEDPPLVDPGSESGPWHIAESYLGLRWSA